LLITPPNEEQSKSRAERIILDIPQGAEHPKKNSTFSSHHQRKPGVFFFNTS